MYKYLGIYIVLTCITCIWVVRNTRNRLDIDELIYAVFATIWINAIFMYGIYLIFS